ncbi:hypothetical protein P7K49_007816 [Saguinus oedipus]|uniref:SAM pointed domain-containing Ets transcription factor n=1 Tax=Saguinus oedipus TaxID=9490 RepID=A0ABQ9VWP3_SAGOE|nr:hypothetical protein P7K49_007816 [Saguinus oedipus]
MSTSLAPTYPVDWSPGNVQKWLLWTEHQYRLPPVGKAFQELAGKELCAMSEEQFRQRSPLGGDVLHAHLDIWKSGFGPGGFPLLKQQPLGPRLESTLNLSPIAAASWILTHSQPGSRPQSFGTAPGRSKGSTSEESWPDSEVDSSCSGQPIHLWQFLKELLLKPHSYGRFIRWLNKEKGERGAQGAGQEQRARRKAQSRETCHRCCGSRDLGRLRCKMDWIHPSNKPSASNCSGIFKIEDSAQVARLWGIRKNRPAMNYDKLSRSIRQYYKKGIIRKPDISQRLVYQFVHPI